MYHRFRRRRTVTPAADADVRQDRADLHRGMPRDILCRHRHESAVAAAGTRQDREHFAACLAGRVASTHILRCALEHVKTEGGRAPGPNGRRLHDLDRFDTWNLVRDLAAALRRGIYRPGPHREVRIPKSRGGFRTLRISNVEDRVVQRAIVEVLQPLVDPNFAATSYGYRPGLSREHALAHVLAVAEGSQRWLWVLEDIRDAFDQVPTQRLLDVVRKRIPSDAVRDLVARVVGKGRGVPQGGSLSPLLLNLYLDHLLDRPWTRQHPQWPLIRVADDLLILTADREQASEARQCLEARLRSAGMPLKGTPQSAIRDLASGESASWLGYHLVRGERGGEARLPEDGAVWDRLRENLNAAHDEPDAPIAAMATIQGWTDSMGPCSPHADVPGTHARIARLAREVAFEEVPTVAELKAQWARAHERWKGIREEWGRKMASASMTAAPPALIVK